MRLPMTRYGNRFSIVNSSVLWKQLAAQYESMFDDVTEQELAQVQEPIFVDKLSSELDATAPLPAVAECNEDEFEQLPQSRVMPAPPEQDATPSQTQPPIQIPQESPTRLVRPQLLQIDSIDTRVVSSRSSRQHVYVNVLLQALSILFLLFTDDSHESHAQSSQADRKQSRDQLTVLINRADVNETPTCQFDQRMFISLLHIFIASLKYPTRISRAPPPSPNDLSQSENISAIGERLAQDTHHSLVFTLF